MFSQIGTHALCTPHEGPSQGWAGLDLSWVDIVFKWAVFFKYWIACIRMIWLEIGLLGFYIRLNRGFTMLYWILRLNIIYKVYGYWVLDYMDIRYDIGICIWYFRLYGVASLYVPPLLLDTWIYRPSGNSLEVFGRVALGRVDCIALVRALCLGMKGFSRMCNIFSAVCVGEK